MINCPNKNTDAWRSLNSLVPDLSNHIWHKLEGQISDNGHPMEDVDRFNKLLEDNDNDYKQTYLQFLGVEDAKIDYQFRSVNNIIKNIIKIDNWSKQIKNQNQLFDKIQKDLGIPKEQIELIKQSEGKDINEKLLDFISKYSYTIEVNTATDNKKSSDEFIFNGDNYGYEIVGDDYGTGAEETVPTRNGIEISQQEFDKAKAEYRRDTNTPSQYYSNLTVPGGTNYTENEIRTPDITPSIKGHAQFSTDQGIGWFRSDDKKRDLTEEQIKEEWPLIEGRRVYIGKKYKDSKTRRILEIQSDLFQKGRDEEDLTEYKYTRSDEGEINFGDEDIYRAERMFYAGNEEYEKGLSTRFREKDVKKNQFLQLLNKDNNWVTFFIKSIIQDSAKKGYEKVLFPKGETAAKVEGHETLANELTKINNELEQLQKIDLSEKGIVEGTGIKNKIANLEQRKSELKSQGIEKLKPIEAFYEIKVQNILKKIDPNIKTITDEFGNQWLEYQLTDKDLNNIEFQKANGESYIFNKKLNDQIKQILQKLYPEVKLNYTTNLEGIRGQYQAGKILINSLSQNTDTLPHEYAHHYIKMFIKSDIVKQGIKLFGSEEKLVQSIGEQSIRALKWYQKLYDWLKGLFSSKQSLLNNLTNSFLEYNRLLDKSAISTERMYQKITKEDVTGDTKKPLNDVLSLPEVPLESKFTKLDKMSEIKEKAIKRLEFKRELNIKRKKPSFDPEAEKVFIEEIKKLEASQAMLRFTRRASKTVDGIYSQWLKIKEKIKLIDEGKLNIDKSVVLNPQILSQWADYLSAFDSLEEFRNALVADGSLYKDEVLKKMLNDTIEKKNAIEKLYDVEGYDMMAGFLEPHNDQIRKDFEILASKSYKKLTPEQKSQISEERYIQVQKELKETKLNEQTFLMLRNELQKATSDIGLARRWVGNILNSSNPVIAAVGQIISFAEMKVHGRKIEIRNRMMPILEKLEKLKKGYKDIRDIYDQILEPKTNRLISKWGSEFLDAYDKVKNDAKQNDKLTDDERGNIIKKWLGENTDFDGLQFRKDKWSYIDSLEKNGEISSEDVRALEVNEADKYWSKSPHALFEDGRISENTANLIAGWQSEHSWDYRTLKDEWLKKNPQWDKFQALRKSNPNDPIVEFYDFIKEYEDEFNSYLPASMRLRNGQLPGVMKTSDERLKAGESFLNITKAKLQRTFDFVATDDITRGNEPLIDERGNKRYFIPMYYTSKLDAKDQSFDLATAYFKWFSTAADYESKNSIYPEMEMIRHFIETRKPDIQTKGKKELKFYNRLSEQFNDWFEMVFYGVKQKDEGKFKIFGLTIDTAKFLDFISKSTAYNILSLNFRAGISNPLIGEVLNTGEAIAKQHMDLKSFHKAHAYYFKNLPGMLGDVGKRKPSNIVNLLSEKFKVDPDQMNNRFRDDTRLKELAKSSSLFFMMTSGDTYLNNTLFLGMLDHKIAYDKDGNKLGSMLDQYSKDKQGNLVLNKEVSLDKSNWNETDQLKFGNKVQYVIEGVQGNYTQLGKTAVQRFALGRMAIMFRKFVVPGIEKRYDKKQFTQRLGDYTEGYYRTTGRFLANLYKEFKTYQFHVLGLEWDKLDHIEKANIVRTISELGFMLTALVIGGAMTRKDRDDSDDSWFYNFSAYQLLRLKTELLFYTNPAEAMQILRSPMATMSLFETTMKIFHQMLHPTDRYTAGVPEWKGHLKMEKLLYDLLPVFRANYQLRDIKTQVSFMK